VSERRRASVHRPSVAHAAANAAGCSIAGRWPASGISTARAPGIRAASSYNTGGGAIASSLPKTTTAGTLIEGSTSVASVRSRSDSSIAMTRSTG